MPRCDEHGAVQVGECGVDTRVAEFGQLVGGVVTQHNQSNAVGVTGEIVHRVSGYRNGFDVHLWVAPTVVESLVSDGFWTEDEPPSGDPYRSDPDEMRFGRGSPGIERGLFGVVDIVVSPRRSRQASDNNTPALGDRIAVSLEQHVLVDRGAGQLGAFGGAEQYRAVLNHEVHRKDLRITVDTGHQPAERYAAEQAPAFAFGKDGDGLGIWRHDRDVTDRPALKTGQKVLRRVHNGKRNRSSSTGVSRTSAPIAGRFECDGIETVLDAEEHAMSTETHLGPEHSAGPGVTSRDV